MTRLAKNRDTPLTREEIAAETLRQFDAGSTAPSIRQLAEALGTTPAAIYHHFPSRAHIYQAGVELVWLETMGNLLEMFEDPFTAEPEDILVAGAVAARRAFMRHYRIAPYASATPSGSDTMANSVALYASLLERLGLDEDEAANAFHTYASFTFGSIIFAATRQIAHDELDSGSPPEYHSAPGEHEASFASDSFREALDSVIDLSIVDPQRDEDLFTEGLRRLVGTFGDGNANAR